MGQCYITRKGFEEKVGEQLGIYPTGANGRPQGDVTVIDKVTTLATNVFRNTTDVNTVKLSPNLKEIQNYAFENCSNLLNLPLPNKLEKIGSYAFSGCTKLTSIELPSSLKELGEYVFSGDTNLINIKIPTNLKIISEYAFSGSNVKEITLPYGLNPDLWASAFRQHASLETVYIECNHLSDNCFYYSPKIKKIYIKSTVRSLGSHAFSSCNDLNSIIFEEGLSWLNDWCFESCSALTSVSLPASLKTIDEYAFDYCHNLISVNLKNGIENINYRSFYNCSNLPSISIPSSIKFIGNGAFEGCSKLAHIYIDKPENSIAGAPWGCKAMVHWREAYINFICDAEQYAIFINGTKISSNLYTFSPQDNGTTITYTAYAVNYKPITKTIYIESAEKATYDEEIIFTEENDCIVTIQPVDEKNNILDDYSIEITYNNFTFKNVSTFKVQNKTDISYIVKKDNYITASESTIITELEQTIKPVMIYNKIDNIILEYPFTNHSEFLTNLLDNVNYKMSEYNIYPHSIMSNRIGYYVKSKGYIKLKTSVDPLQELHLKIKGNLVSYSSNTQCMIAFGRQIYLPGTDGQGFYADDNVPSNVTKLIYINGKNTAINIDQIFQILPNTNYYISFWVQCWAGGYPSGEDQMHTGRLYLDYIEFQSAPIDEQRPELPTIISGDKICVYDGIGKITPYINEEYFGSPPESQIIFNRFFNYNPANSIYVDTPRHQGYNCATNRLAKAFSINDANGGNIDSGIFKFIKNIDCTSYSKVKVTCILHHDFGSPLITNAYMFIGQDEEVAEPVANTPYDWAAWTVIGEHTAAGSGSFYTCTYDISELEGEQSLFIGVFHGTETNGYTCQCRVVELEIQ